MATKKKVDTEEKVKKIYIGPSIPRSQLRNAEILEGTEEEINAYIAKYSERYPEIKFLLVDPDKLPEEQQKVRTKGNILNKYYKDMEAKAIVSRKGVNIYA